LLRLAELELIERERRMVERRIREARFPTEERGIFDWLRGCLVQAGLSYRELFCTTGGLAFALSSVADNLTTALVMSAVVMALGGAMPRFVTLSCINIVVSANAGGAFSPFGDITTLMVWQKGLVAFQEFFRLFLPSVVNLVVPAQLMHVAVPRGHPTPKAVAVTVKTGAGWITLLFIATIATVIVVHAFLHLPAVLGMMTGLGHLQLLDYFLQLRGRAQGRVSDYTLCVPAPRCGRVGHPPVLLRSDDVRQCARSARLSNPDLASPV
jgi:Na+/H+ antiporter NhaD/arsenite permease-like protein